MTVEWHYQVKMKWLFWGRERFWGTFEWRRQ
jgi:hypothetical protein